MFFYLSKILAFVISPETWIIICFILGFVFYNTYPNRSKYFLIAAFTLFIIYTNKFLAYEALRSWETPVTVLSPADTAFDAGIVLGGGMVVEDTQNKRLVFQQNVDRILQAIQLYKEKKIRTIIISSGAGSLVFPEMLEASLLKRYFTKIGIPAQDIIVDSLSNNTFENAVNTKEILHTQFPGQPRLLLITSSFHMKRAKGCFDKLNIKTTIYTTNKIAGKRAYRPDLFLPSVDACGLWKKYIHEAMGYYIYNMMGYL